MASQNVSDGFLFAFLVWPIGAGVVLGLYNWVMACVAGPCVLF